METVISVVKSSSGVVLQNCHTYKKQIQLALSESHLEQIDLAEVLRYSCTQIQNQVKQS